MSQRLLWAALLGAVLCLLASGIAEASGRGKPPGRGCPPRCVRATQGGPGGPVAPATSQSHRVQRVVASSRSVSGRFHAVGGHFHAPTLASNPALNMRRFRALEKATRRAEEPPASSRRARATRRMSLAQSGLEPPSRETVEAWKQSAHRSRGGIGAEPGGPAVPAKPASQYDSVAAVLAKRAQRAPQEIAPTEGGEAEATSTGTANGLPTSQYASIDGALQAQPAAPAHSIIPLSGTAGPAGPQGGFTALPRRPGRDPSEQKNDLLADDQALKFRIRTHEANMGRLVDLQIRVSRRILESPDSTEVQAERWEREVEPLRVERQRIVGEIVRLRAKREDLDQRWMMVNAFTPVTHPMELP